MFSIRILVILGIFISNSSFAEPSNSEKTRLILSQLGNGKENWIDLKSSEGNTKLGTAVYKAYDSGSINKVKGIVYVRALLGNIYGASRKTTIIAFSCKLKKSIELSISDAGIEDGYYVWHGGKIRFQNDGQDTTILEYPNENFPEANELFVIVCGNNSFTSKSHAK